MRDRYKKRLAEKLYEQENQETYILTEKKNDPDSNSLVKIVFLTEQASEEPDLETSIGDENTLENAASKHKPSTKELNYINEDDEKKGRKIFVLSFN